MKNDSKRIESLSKQPMIEQGMNVVAGLPSPGCRRFRIILCWKHSPRSGSSCSQADYRRLASLSASHIYNLRRTAAYRQHHVHHTRTRSRAVAIGERRRPNPCGRSGYLRVDTVHQGDTDTRPGLYHINAVCETWFGWAADCGHEVKTSPESKALRRGGGSWLRRKSYSKVVVTRHHLRIRWGNQAHPAAREAARRHRSVRI